jgi:hypothetical protein
MQIFLPNENVSFNSIDELQHFHTTEDVLINGDSQAFGDMRMPDSSKFLMETLKRDEDDAFGVPVVAKTEESWVNPILSFIVDNVTPFNNDHIIGTIPVITPTSESTAYTDLIHLNVQHNPSSFAVVPVYKYAFK